MFMSTYNYESLTLTETGDHRPDPDGISLHHLDTEQPLATVRNRSQKVDLINSNKYTTCGKAKANLFFIFFYPFKIIRQKTYQMD